MGRRLKDGLNDLLGRMEVPGSATGPPGAVFLRLGVDNDSDDDEVCLMSPEQHAIVMDSKRNSQWTLAMLNHGVHVSGPRFLMMSAHTEEIIDETIDAAEKSLNELRGAGLI